VDFEQWLGQVDPGRPAHHALNGDYKEAEKATYVNQYVVILFISLLGIEFTIHVCIWPICETRSALNLHSMRRRWST
jgi:hypothetical protein